MRPTGKVTQNTSRSAKTLTATTLRVVCKEINQFQVYFKVLQPRELYYRSTESVLDLVRKPKLRCDQCTSISNVREAFSSFYKKRQFTTAPAASCAVTFRVCRGGGRGHTFFPSSLFRFENFCESRSFDTSIC